MTAREAVEEALNKPQTVELYTKILELTNTKHLPLGQCVVALGIAFGFALQGIKDDFTRDEIRKVIFELSQVKLED